MALKDKILKNLRESDEMMARKSLEEENKAIRDYTERMNKCKDKKLKELFAHAIKEEKEHSKLFAECLEEYAV
ncbi:MAG TPA: ferritin family protein [Clostridia bacterium]